MKRNLIAVVLFGLVSAQGGTASAGMPTNGPHLNGLGMNGLYISVRPRSEE